ncbi:hypothetical protein CGK42_23655 [Vibrio parahaemolyticus]|uniref:hypothetical protein n=1 Tax=Vibrio parahaemolyticus TaxID=670 RepID=UPI00112081EA|nr:hypothetical protein [Vibrio parahaemolyticus]TNZ66361.1 hypothetical protein CGK42_23655 [Vibrio parahaemolyticus]
MFFEESFIEKVEDDPILGLHETCSITLSRLAELENGQEWTEEEHELLWEASAFINILINNFDLTIAVDLPQPTGSLEDNCNALSEYIQEVQSAVGNQAVLLKVKTYSNRYKNAFKSTFAYEFSKGDLERVQELINELRAQISTLEDLEPSHQQRLLKRLEKLQSELHKRVSDLDRFWGLIGDAGVVLGKLGTDAKPIVDRIKEIAEIAWNTQSRTEELPSNSPNPMLGDPEDCT